jgi:hypothetical protein
MFPVFSNCNCYSRWCPMLSWYCTANQYIVAYVFWSFVFLFCFCYNGNVNLPFQLFCL